MTIDSVPITRSAFLNTGDNTIRIPSTSSSGTVQLTISPNAVSNRIVQNGIPLAIGSVSNTNELVVKNDLGVEIDAQFDILSNWPDGSIKSVLVTCEVVADPVTEKLYSLDYGAGVTQSSYSTNLGYTEDANEYVVSTGKTRVTLDKLTGALIKSAYADTAGDQTYTTQVLGASEIFSQDGITSTQFAASNEAAPTWTVMRNGPMCLQFRAVGYLRDVSNNTYTQFRVWFTFYNDTEFFDIEYTMVDDVAQPTNISFDVDSGTVEFSCRNLGWTFAHSIASNHQYIFGGESSNSVGSLTAEQYLFQNGALHSNANASFTTSITATSDDATGQSQTYSGIQTGNRAKGYSTCHNGTVGCTTILKNFWQQWPNELSMDTSEMKVHLHPERYHGGSVVHAYSADGNGFLIKPNTLYHHRHGVAKTFEMRLIIHAATPTATEIEKVVTNFADYKIQLKCTANHYCTCGVFGDIIPRDSASAVYDDSALNNVLLRSYTNQPHRSKPYGWRDHGDHYRGGWEFTSPTRISGIYNGAHIGAVNYMLMYFKTLENDWLEESLNQTRHFMDIDVSHSAISGRYTPVEPLPAGMIKSASHKEFDHDARNAHDGHVHLSAMPYIYLLTGNQRIYEVLEETANYFDHVSTFHYPLPRPATDYGGAMGQRRFMEAEREMGWPLHCQTQWVGISNDAAYHLNNSSRMIEFLIDWWQTPANHVVADVVLGYSDHTTGTGFWNLDQTDNGTNGTYSNGCQPWMCASILQAVVDWYNQELLYSNSGINLQDVRDMCYQQIQHIFTWGYSGDGYNFYYSEDRHLLDGYASRQLASPLATIYLWYQADILASNIANPSWFDDALWKTVLMNHYNTWKQTGLGLQSGGFYGYELQFPQTFWKNAAIIEAE